MALPILNQKYRPSSFKDVLDQEDNITILKNLIRNNKMHQPLMFSGLTGIGKTTLARIYAKALLCTNRTADLEPCNTCMSCVSFNEGTHLSFMEIDAASNSGVDSIKQIKDNAAYKSLGDSQFNIVLIDECQTISSAGNKALFKQLEESIGRQIYIFCTTSPEDMATEIRARCFELSLNRVTKESIAKRLKEICDKEQILAHEDALMSIASYNAPHVRNAIRDLDYLSNLGAITPKLVEDKLDMASDIHVMNLLINLKSDIKASFLLLDTLMLKNDIKTIYEKLINVMLKSLKLQHNVNHFINSTQTDLGKLILSLYSTNLYIFIDKLLSRTIYVDRNILEADLFFIRYILNNKAVKLVNTEMPTTTISKVDVKPAAEIKVTLENDTSKILERYKSHSPQVAMMMSKCKNSSLTNTNGSVKLLHNVKDFKSNLSKTEVRNILNEKVGSSTTNS